MEGGKEPFIAYTVLNIINVLVIVLVVGYLFDSFYKVRDVEEKEEEIQHKPPVAFSTALSRLAFKAAVIVVFSLIALHGVIKSLYRNS